MDQAEITARIRDRLGGRILMWADTVGQHAVTVAPEELVSLLLWMRDEPDLDFTVLSDLSGVDYLGYGPAAAGTVGERTWRFEVAYQLFSLERGHRYRVKVAVADESVKVPTVAHIWRVANWMEREVWDQFGVVFAGHENLRRILNHDAFVGHPLRKDYPIARRQKLASPVERILPDDPDWA